MALIEEPGLFILSRFRIYLGKIASPQVLSIISQLPMASADTSNNTEITMYAWLLFVLTRTYYANDYERNCAVT